MNMHGLCYLRKPYRRLYKFHLYTLPIHLYTHFIYNSMIHQKNIYIYIYIKKIESCDTVSFFSKFRGGNTLLESIER